MSMDKEKYKERLHTFVLELKSQDPELLEFLRNEIDYSLPQSRIDKIEKYLGLDYKLDTINPDNTLFSEIDYAFISDDALRDQLISDFREMMRYRYGCRSHREDFVEYCKYAHFQLEGLTNYFMDLWCHPNSNEKLTKIEKVKTNIINNWIWDKPPKNIDNWLTIYDVDYNTKITAILNFSNLNKRKIDGDWIPTIVKNIRLVRNGINHRGEPTTQNDSVQEWMLRLPWIQVGNTIASLTDVIKKYELKK